MIAREILQEANEQIGFEHPTDKRLNYISFCQFMEPIELNTDGKKTGKKTVVIRPGKLDRSTCGNGTSARLALLRQKNEIEIGEKMISKSIIGSYFETFIESETIESLFESLIPLIPLEDLPLKTLNFFDSNRIHFPCLVLKIIS